MSTLYVTEQGVQVHLRGERLLIQRGNDVLQDIPIIKVDQIVLMGKGVGITTSAKFALARRSIPILHTTQKGTYVGQTIGREHNHSRLRYTQAHAISDDTAARAIAISIVVGKINNQRVLVQRHAEGAGWARRALENMDKMRRQVENAQTLDEVRGHEGLAAKEYFSIFRRLLRPPRDGQGWNFDRREYYPPPDPVNALLSFGYTLLLNHLVTACQIAGLDPDMGFFHSVDFGKPAMALDLEEEFRPVIVDSIVLYAINRPMLGLADFEAVQYQPKQGPDTSPRPAVLLREESRKQFIALYETRINESVYYPPAQETTTYRRIFELQAYQMARVILGEAEGYVPLMVR